MKEEVGFEKWLLTARGKKVLESFQSAPEKDKEYLKNCLWWAYHAGNTADQIWMKTPIEEIFEVLAEPNRKTIPAYIKHKIQYVLDHKADYSIKKL